MSGQVTTGRGQPAELDTGTLTEEEVATIREAEQERRLKPVDGSVPEQLTLDKTFELLKNQRRRRVLRYLMNNGESSTTGELAEHVAVLENDKDDVNSLTSKERKAAYVGLYQCHLPKMDDYGVVRFNQARGRVELTELAYELEEYLTPNIGPRWPLRYLAIAGSGGTLFIGSFLVGASLLPIGIAFATVAAIITVALGHWWSQRSE
jgi:hypothetical protein